MRVNILYMCVYIVCVCVCACLQVETELRSVLDFVITSVITYHYAGGGGELCNKEKRMYDVGMDTHVGRRRNLCVCVLWQEMKM